MDIYLLILLEIILGNKKIIKILKIFKKKTVKINIK